MVISPVMKGVDNPAAGKVYVCTSLATKLIKPNPGH